MAFAKFQENRFRIDGEIAENHAILVNLTASTLECASSSQGKSKHKSANCKLKGFSCIHVYINNWFESRSGCIFVIVVVHIQGSKTVQMHGVYRNFFGTVHFKESSKSFEIRVGHSLGFGLSFVAILPQCAERDIKKYSLIHCCRFCCRPYTVVHDQPQSCMYVTCYNISHWNTEDVIHVYTCISFHVYISFHTSSKVSKI